MNGLSGRRVLITGGLGFIGSNLAIRLVGLGAEVMTVDAMIPGYGGNLFNIEPIKDDVGVNFSDIRDPHSMNYLVCGQDIVYHLAGQVDHILSLTDPFPDIDMNIKGTAVVMEALKHNNPNAILIYSGTRGQCDHHHRRGGFRVQHGARQLGRIGRLGRPDVRFHRR